MNSQQAYVCQQRHSIMIHASQGELRYYDHNKSSPHSPSQHVTDPRNRRGWRPSTYAYTTTASVAYTTTASVAYTTTASVAYKISYSDSRGSEDNFRHNAKTST
jgi:hypothetical protein